MITETHGTEATVSVLTREFCDASAFKSEYAANYVITVRGGTLALCQHHTDTNARTFAKIGATVTPIPAIYAATDENTEQDTQTEFGAYVAGQSPDGTAGANA